MFWFWLIAAVVAVSASRPQESYSESLLVRRLDPSSLGLRFEFVSRKADSSASYETFPKVVDQMVSRNVSELRLVLTRGSWRWGSETLWPAVESGAPGVEVWAELADPARDWPPLLRSLSGLTCASLDDVVFGSVSNHTVFAHLPSETVCVENLSLFTKLLPCRDKAGLGRLIRSKQIVREAFYYALVISVRRRKTGIELVQSLSLVLPHRDNLSAVLPGPWATASSCGEGVTVVVEGGVDSLSPLPQATFPGGAVWPLVDISGLDSLVPFVPSRQVTVTKWQTGTGFTKGTMSSRIECEPGLELEHVEFLPFFLLPRMRSLELSIVPKSRRFVSSSRISPGFLVLSIVCPESGSVHLSYAFDKRFLFLEQYPPNPNRGFDVPASVTMFNSSKVDSGPGVIRRSHAGPVRVASKALLVYLAHPDFSMPYNVITLSSTGFAMFLGMVVNIVVRRRGDRWVPQSDSLGKRVVSLFFVKH